MDWYKFCDDVLHFGGPCMEYAFVGTVEGTWGEIDRGWKFSRLTNFEVSTIVNSNTSNFYLRGEEYKFLKTERDIVTYESPTRAIAFGMGPYCKMSMHC
ncbi:unnamed protein product [Clavelina lepadiformis]|uniref:Jacalin-type lectin domain-containing protein n=1 Tax=Clavelina lepadiformis TaxID=159417 RepID=A0ABP0GJD2_CLALP